MHLTSANANWALIILLVTVYLQNWNLIVVQTHFCTATMGAFAHLGGTFELFYQKHNFETLYISKIKLMNLDQIDFYKPSLGITFWMYVTSK